MITEKICEGQKGAKARSVARGFEDKDQVPSDSPPAAKSTLKTVLAITANEGWITEIIDIKAAFLQSRTTNRNIYIYIYILPPPEAYGNILYGNWKRQFMAWTMHLVSGISV